ncbi:MAG: diacylglycerol kinase family lipid kinase [Clostridiales bacterium]|nr:diacylglycerol kinase family lipid kinase [Clostridiales bacterium]
MIHIIVNPIAGNGMAHNVGKQLYQLLQDKRIPFSFEQTTHPGHATQIAAQAAKKGIGTVLSVGGDGTAYEVASGLVNTDCALGIIPAGTGNDIIKTLSFPKKPIEALETILQGKKKKMDIGKINDQFFLNVCGTGFDVAVLENSLNAKKYVKGIFPYLYGLIKTIFTFKPINIKITIDGTLLPPEPLLLCTVANGKYIGGGIPIAPTADIHDHLLDVVIVKAVPNYKMAKYVPGLLSGKILSFPITEHYLCTSVKIESSDMKTNIDGEIITLQGAAFELIADALWVHY